VYHTVNLWINLLQVVSKLFMHVLRWPHYIFISRGEGQGYKIPKLLFVHNRAIDGTTDLN